MVEEAVQLDGQKADEELDQAEEVARRQEFLNALAAGTEGWIITSSVEDDAWTHISMTAVT